MSTLYGLSLDSFYGIDHTYVTSSDGHVWKCWGRSSGGQVICSGTADSKQAGCLAQKNSHAGLLYGLTGVCHQTANRILFPARCIVSGATNYWLTNLLYGTYGLSVVKFQSRITNCLRGQDYLAPRHNDPTELSNEAVYLQRINLLYANTSAKLRQAGVSKERTLFQLLQNELKLTVVYRLGDEATTKVAKDLMNYQSDLLLEKNFYDRALMANRLNPVRYADKVNEIANIAFKDINKSLGEQRYLKMFGVTPEIQFIDPEIMYEFYKRSDR